MTEEHYDQIVKVLLVGDTEVGKSQIFSRFTSGQFTDSFLTTIGVEFANKMMYLPGTVVKAQIWDTAGQERFRSITSSYYRGARAVLLVFDLTKRESFEHLSNWREECSRSGPEQITIVVVGNKSDLADQRQVSYEEAQNWASSHGASYFEVSAKSGANVSSAFEAAVNAEGLGGSQPIIEDILRDERLRDIPVDITPYSDIIDPFQPRAPAGPFDSLIEGLKKLADIEKDEDKEHVKQFHTAQEGKHVETSLAVSFGEFYQQCGLYLRYKTGHEVYSLSQDLGISPKGIGLAFSLKVSDSVDVFELGELSSSIKMLYDAAPKEPGLDKITLNTKVVSEYDGTRVFRVVFELKEDGVFDALQQLIKYYEPSRLEISAEFSERPVRNPPTQTSHFRVTCNTVSKRPVLNLCERILAETAFRDMRSLLPILSLLKKANMSLEFESIEEFWTLLTRDGSEPPEALKRFGWNMVAYGLMEWVHNNFHANQHNVPPPVTDLYKKAVDVLVGLHSVQLVVGSEQVLELKGEEFNIFALLPTWKELDEKFPSGQGGGGDSLPLEPIAQHTWEYDRIV